MKQITNEACDVIKLFLPDTETIETIEKAVQLNKEFNNQYPIEKYFSKNEQDINEYVLCNTLYDSILLWGYDYFIKKLMSIGIYIGYIYYQMECVGPQKHLQMKLDKIDSSIKDKQLAGDAICKYFINKFKLNLNI